VFSESLPESQPLVPEFQAAHGYDVCAMREGLLITDIPPASWARMGIQPIAFLRTVTVIRPETPSAMWAMADVVPISHVMVLGQIIEIQI
jgi:hypothetical protein